jgi:hypothetical protein
MRLSENVMCLFGIGIGTEGSANLPMSLNILIQERARDPQLYDVFA